MLHRRNPELQWVSELHLRVAAVRVLLERIGETRTRLCRGN
jgi:hypothetical protein